MEFYWRGFRGVTRRFNRRAKFRHLWTRQFQFTFVSFCYRQFCRVSTHARLVHTKTGLDFEKPQTDTAFGRVWHFLQQCRAPVFHAIGNHELYNFKAGELRTRFNEAGGTQVPPYAYVDPWLRVRTTHIPFGYVCGHHTNMGRLVT